MNDLDKFVLQVGAIKSIISTKLHMDYSLVDLKMDLSEIWIKKNKSLFPVYSYLKYIYTNSENLPLVEPANLGDILVYVFVFADLITTKEILLMHNHTRRFDSKYYQQLNSAYSANRIEIKYLTNLAKYDSYELLHMIIIISRNSFADCDRHRCNQYFE